MAPCDVFVFFDHVQMPGGKSFVSRNAVKSVQGRTWLTGAGEGSMRHLDIGRLAADGIETKIINWGSPTYLQQHRAFEPNLSAIDAILNCGPEQAATLVAGP
jgi:hypothetical protein